MTVSTRALFLILISAFSMAAHAECVRWKPAPRPANAVPDLDGPGSFRQLQDTVTLDCLTYVGSIQKDGVEHVLISDERGTIHTLRRGSYMGENTGIIERIGDDAIYIRQIVRRNGKREELIVRFPKRQKVTGGAIVKGIQWL